jgi:hypothetical protein
MLAEVSLLDSVNARPVLLGTMLMYGGCNRVVSSGDGLRGQCLWNRLPYSLQQRGLTDVV